ncbi:MAG TPA: site-specific integrase, partial [Ktedonobacterales bacterium]|nr:site-specific integrase [Ktedonobacterales bacterium]
MASITRVTIGGQVRYRVRAVVAHYPNGKARQQMRTFDSRREADRWGREAEARAAAGQGSEPGRLTVDRYLSDWLAEWAQHVRPSTLAAYRLLVDRYVRPRLAGLLLRDASALALQRLLNDLPTADTKNRVRGLLHTALGRAAELGLLPANPVERTRVPRHEPRAGQAWSVEEARRFLEAAAEHPYQPFWILAVCTGMRPSELVALTWADVDLAAGTLTIRAGRPTVGNMQYDGGPKSKAGRRTLMLAPE